jgi:hypothetical protein
MSSRQLEREILNQNRIVLNFFIIAGSVWLVLAVCLVIYAILAWQLDLNSSFLSEVLRRALPPAAGGGLSLQCFREAAKIPLRNIELLDRNRANDLAKKRKELSPSSSLHLSRKSKSAGR